MARQNKQQQQHSQQRRKSFLRIVLRSSRLRVASLDSPLRIRWWLAGSTVFWAGLMAVLGFTQVALPLNDKLLHFVTFAVLAALVFLSLDVDDSARRLWYWRIAPSIFTITLCSLCASVVSEFVQALLPYKEFQHGDVAANVLGSLIGWLGKLGAYTADRIRRRRRAISALYVPLAADADDDDDIESEDEYEQGLQQAAFRVPASFKSHRRQGSLETIDSLRMANVWDEQLGDSDDDLQRGHSQIRA
ncbi:hypothetical protein BKA62DRAFT_681262 [Auriculariales sp. MPI-PUGE-AT-0066]|nr:hypothetical protein BKA62DRAFT_681262 [Auriculariales sp. MPI-PUGE-AT-0066]